MSFAQTLVIKAANAIAARQWLHDAQSD